MKCKICRNIATNFIPIDTGRTVKLRLCDRCLSDLLAIESDLSSSSGSEFDFDASETSSVVALEDESDILADLNPHKLDVRIHVPPPEKAESEFSPADSPRDDDQNSSCSDLEALSNQQEEEKPRRKRRRVVSEEKLKVKCTLCDERATNRRSLAYHMRKCHPEEKVNRCHICRLFFKGMEQFEQHIRSEHEGFSHTCVICLEGYGRDEKQEHEKRCLGRSMFECDICQQSYVTKDGLIKHLTKHEIPEDQLKQSYQENRSFQKIYSCVLCDDGRGYLEDPYWNHIHQDHDGRHLRCPDCGKTFRTRKHMVVHTGVQCKVGFKAREKAAKLHELVESQCQHCSKSFRNRTLLQNHIAKIHKAKPIVCDVCGLNLANRNQMRYHKAKAHTEPKEQCPHCPKMFHLATDLRQHLTTHETIGKFVCEECGRVFKRKVGLELHIKSHQRDPGTANKRLTASGSGNFACEICNKRFKHNYVLVTHRKIHDPTRVLEKKFGCKECDKKFATSAGLYYHMKGKYVHQKFTCPVCSTLVKGKERYEEHLLIHSEQN